MSQYNIKDVNKLLEQYQIKITQLTNENIFLNAAVNELQAEVDSLKVDKEEN